MSTVLCIRTSFCVSRAHGGEYAGCCEASDVSLHHDADGLVLKPVYNNKD